MRKIAAALFATTLFNASPLMAAAINKTSTLIDQRYAAPQNMTSSQPQFAGVIDDLPLMPGLELMPDEDVLFATPEGRIAETTAQGEVDIDEVYAFYKRSLPHLGWSIVDGRTYRREGETLRIDARANGKVSTVQFTVKPNTPAK